MSCWVLRLFLASPMKLLLERHLRDDVDVVPERVEQVETLVVLHDSLFEPLDEVQGDRDVALLVRHVLIAVVALASLLLHRRGQRVDDGLLTLNNNQQSQRSSSWPTPSPAVPAPASRCCSGRSAGSTPRRCRYFAPNASTLTHTNALAEAIKHRAPTTTYRGLINLIIA